MKEKIYDIPIDHSLTAPRRKALDKFLKDNASKLKWASNHEWDEDNDHLLHIVTGPVKWEVWFAPQRVTVFGSGPFWAKMFFSNQKKLQLRDGILYVLKEAGFLKAKTPAKKAKAA